MYLFRNTDSRVSQKTNSYTLAMMIDKARSCNLPQVQAAEKLFPEIVKQATSWDSEYITVIHVFARYNCKSALEYYLNQNYDADMINKVELYMHGLDFLGRTIPHHYTNFTDYTPLSYAAKWGAKESVDLLLARNAELDYISMPLGGLTPLMVAGLYHQPHIVSTLLDHGANQTILDIHGYSLRDMMTIRGYTEIIDILDQYPI